MFMFFAKQMMKVLMSYSGPSLHFYGVIILVKNQTPYQNNVMATIPKIPIGQLQAAYYSLHLQLTNI